MKYFLCLLLAAGSLFAQSGVAPGTVVASFGDVKLTAGELEKIVEGLPSQIQKNYALDRKEFVRQYALMLTLAKIAEKANLDKESPVKERLAWTRMQVLSQAQIDQSYSDVNMTLEEVKELYEKSKDRFTEAKLKVIYISFVANPVASADPQAKKPLSEAEAKAKAEKLAKELRAGADFAALAKEHSEDPASAQKGGDFGTVKRSDSLPEAIKSVVFALKPNQVSDPVRQPNGFYIFRTDEIIVQPFDKVRDDLIKDIKETKMKDWFDTTRKGVDVKFENEAFFAKPAAAPAPAPVK